MAPTTIEGIVLAGHKGAALEVPFDPGARWSVASVRAGPRRRGTAVRVTWGGRSFDTFVVARSRRFWVLLPNAELAATGTSIGDRVTIALDRRDDDTEGAP